MDTLAKILSCALSWRIKWQSAPDLDSRITSASFNGVDIFIITERNTGYRLDTNLNLKQALSLGPLGKNVSVACHSFHSNLLAYADNIGFLKMIDTRRLTPVKEIYVPNDFFTETSMTGKYIMAGTENGVVRLWDRSGTQKLDFKADDYIHSVSIRDTMILAASSKRVYLWQLDKYGKPHGPDSYSLNPKNNILWVCFNPFQRQPRSVPYLVGKSGYKPQWERARRPMILKAYSANEKEYAISTIGRCGRLLKIRDLKTEQVIRSIRLKAEPDMIWANREALFVIYPYSRTVEKTLLKVESRSITNRSIYLESVSLYQPHGP